MRPLRWLMPTGALALSLACSAPDTSYRDAWCAQFCTVAPLHADCSTECPPLESPDASTAGDGGVVDGGAEDAGSREGGADDAGTPDAGDVDAGEVDAGGSDAGPADAGLADAGRADAGAADAGTVDGGPPDAGPPDAGAPDAGPGPTLFAHAVDGTQRLAAGECELLQVGVSGLAVGQSESIEVRNPGGLTLYSDLNCYSPLGASVTATQASPGQVYVRSPLVGASSFKITSTNYGGVTRVIDFTGRLNVNPLPLTGCAANYSVRLTSPKNPKTPVFAAVNVVLDAGLGTWAVNTGCAVSLPVVSVPTDGGLATFGVMTSASLVVSAVNLGQDIFPSDTTSSLSLGANGACNGGLDCVSGSCSANRCSCVESGGTCQNASDCCVGNCSTGTCP